MQHAGHRRLTGNHLVHSESCDLLCACNAQDRAHARVRQSCVSQKPLHRAINVERSSLLTTAAICTSVHHQDVVRLGCQTHQCNAGYPRVIQQRVQSHAFISTPQLKVAQFITSSLHYLKAFLFGDVMRLFGDCGGIDNGMRS